MGEPTPNQPDVPATPPPSRPWLGRVSAIATCLCILAAVVVFTNLVAESKALSYMSSDPRACINCHAMHTQYDTWMHSSHAAHATCVDCHLPRGSTVDKLLAKSRDGWNHSVAFTLDTYEHVIQISEDGARRVQDNCIACHSMATEGMRRNAAHYEFFENPGVASGRRCWDCHKSVPHGKVRAINTTPYRLGHEEPK